MISLLQGDVPKDEAICFRCKRQMPCDQHHLLNKSEKQFAERIGAMVWLCRGCHRYIHDTGAGQREWRVWKAQAEAEYLKTHSLEEWMQGAHRNYL